MVRSRFDITKWRVAGAGVAAVAVVATVLAGCANVGQQNAQTGVAVPASGVSVDSSAAASAGAGGSAASTATTATASPAAAPAEPQIYKVRRGDTLSRIAQNHGCSVADLQTWNGLKRSARLKAGQTLKVSSPDATATASTNVSNPSSAEAAAATTENTSASTDQTDPALARQVAAQAARHANGVALTWPAQGKVVESFQPGETRGIEISGKSGDPILAAANGKVMYAGTGLNEYGSLIIVQHNKDFLTTYAHNRRLLVKTGDIVRQGQQIAEMGDENNSRVAVLFEVRRDGKPVDPMPYLPRRG